MATKKGTRMELALNSAGTQNTHGAGRPRQGGSSHVSHSGSGQTESHCLFLWTIITPRPVWTAAQGREGPGERDSLREDQAVVTAGCRQNQSAGVGEKGLQKSAGAPLRSTAELGEVRQGRPMEPQGPTPGAALGSSTLAPAASVQDLMTRCTQAMARKGPASEQGHFTSWKSTQTQPDKAAGEPWKGQVNELPERTKVKTLHRSKIFQNTIKTLG